MTPADLPLDAPVIVAPENELVVVGCGLPESPMVACVATPGDIAVYRLGGWCVTHLYRPGPR